MLHNGASWLVSTFAALCAAAGETVDADKLAPFRPVSIKTAANEPTQIDLPGGPLGRQYLVVLGTPNSGDKGNVVRIDRARIEKTEPLASEAADADSAWVQKTERRRGLMAQRRLYAEREPTPVSVGKIAPKKTFHLFIKDGNFHDDAN